MNYFVRRWKAHEQQPRLNTPDALEIDGEKRIMAERKKPETKSKNHTDKVLHREAAKRISVNRHAVVKLAIEGNVNQVNALYRETSRTFERLGARRWKGVEPFTSVPRGKGAIPAMIDLLPWLDSLQRSDTEEVEFLKRLHKTLELRCTC